VILGGITVAATLTRGEQLARVARRLAPGRLRRWAAGATSLGLLGSAVAATIPLERAPGATSDVGHLPRTAPTTTSSPTTTTTAPTPPPHHAPLPSPAPSPVPAPLLATPVGPAAPTTWTVRRGDHLWSIAESTLRDRRGASVTEGDVRRYWAALIASNRERLADPANPDLIFAGQVFLLPPS
jgi:nucleoid-associated protein YgaU